ncbi:hypothetical protein ABEB36_007008 [Hypothenemus hampei]|uniref:isopentenyl-diphosphate Delta-isomerase n=1 Tax=Hypothenemus hampei TaxID=57062 RepID=A0ABD1EUR0_HYPHA
MDRIQSLLLNEKCFLVNENDVIIGEATKKECHLVANNGNIKLHRAFSVFLFNSKNELLIQKRSAAKITYPNRYTNTCCSHPLSEIPSEKEDINFLGIKRAAQRRLNYELGIPKEDIPLETIHFLKRIHYKDAGDGTYGEHEIDYILFIQRDVRLKVNPNEISEAFYIHIDDIHNFVEDNIGKLTPWFHLIYTSGLMMNWWKNLKNLCQFNDDKEILKLSFNSKEN